MRVHELAKELDISSKELLDELHELGISAKTHASALSKKDVAHIRDEYGVEAPDASSGEQGEMKAGEAAEGEQHAADETSPVEEKDSAVEEPEEVAGNTIIIPDAPIIVKEFASQLGMKPNQLIAELMTMNVFASINEKLNFKIAKRLAEKHDIVLEVAKPEPPPAPPEPEPEVVSEENAAEEMDEEARRRALEEKEERKREREKNKRINKGKGEPLEYNEIVPPPIVTFLGHVDHGKTSLLDRIRNTRVADGEDGGITQHIGAYTVDYNERKITFLDTPGHAAFTAMRARGANLTDVAVLIVAADDGIMPQTREAIQHAKAAGVCVVVAINKMDLPGANPDRVKQQLQQEELAPEDWGGEVGCCPVSAATGEGIDELLDRILLEAEMLDLKATPGGPAEGYVIEAEMEPGRGPTASLLVRDGTLKVGDAITCGTSWGKIKSLINDHGIIVRTAGPSTPVKCLGLNSVPEAGESIEVHRNDKEAKAVAEARRAEKRKDTLAPKKMSLEDWLGQSPTNSVQELTLVLKADVKGSVEAIRQSLEEIDSDKVSLNFLLTGVGNISNNDVLLASASNAIIVGFHVGLESGVNKSAKHEGVEIRLYSVIYELLDDIREAMTGLLEPEIQENVIGHAKILQLFNLNKRNKIAGCICTDGRITAKSHVRVLRDGEKVFQGRLASLKRFQNDANEIRETQECGLRIDRFEDYREDDELEFFEVQKIVQEL
jgi:translation initiation factor IF-2